MLEDVASHDFYMNHGAPPPAGTRLTIKIQSRIIAVAGNESVGSLPTRLNYLAGCLTEGFIYEGMVTKSSNGSHPQVQVDFVVL